MHLFSPAEAAARELWAWRFVTETTGVARGLGYALFYGRSLVSDIDLLAITWRDRGTGNLTHVEFVLGLCHCFPLTMGNHGETNFDHCWYARWHKLHPKQQINLKVILPAEKLAVGA